MIRINLLGHEPVKAKKKRAMPELTIGGSENVTFIAAIFGTLIVLGAVWWLQSSSLATLETEHSTVAAEQQQQAEIAEQVRQMEDRRASVNQKLDVIVDLKKSQSGPVLLLDQLSRELPDSLWLTDITLDEGGEVTLIGQALSNVAIADFGQNLRLSSFFADTSPQFTQDTGDSVRFQISTRFVPLTPSAPEPEAGAATGPVGANR